MRRGADGLIEQRVDLPPDQVVVGLREAAIGDVLDVGVRDAGEQQQREVGDRADAGAAHAQLALLGERDEVLQRLDRQRLVGEKDHRRGGDQHDGLEVGARIIGQVLVEPDARRVGAEVAHHHGVSIGRRLGDAARPDGAARAGDVLDDELLAERHAHVLPEDARQHVGRPAPPRTARSW